MKKFRMLICLVLTAIMTVAVLGACKDPKNRDYDLKVAVRLGEYGSMWIEKLAAEFEEEYGVKVKVEANPNLQAEIPSRLENGNDDDIFFCDGIAWEQRSARSQLRNLDELYNTVINPDVAADNVIFKDRVSADFIDTASFQNHFWKVPWTNGAGGLIYNKVLFDKNNWPVPTVYSNPDNPECSMDKPAGLVELCAKIDAAKLPVDPNNTKPDAPRVKPFVWSQEQYYWDYLVFDWWVQLAGEEELTKYKLADDADLFDHTKYPSHKKALQAWDDLVGNHREYSADDSAGKKYTAAQMEFVNGNAAMIPNAQWLEMGMRGKYDPTVCEMVLMPAPFMEGAQKDADGNPIRVNYAVGAGDSIMIPARAVNPELAEKFLLFMARKENIRAFTENTMGVMLAMDYTGIEPKETDAAFLKSVFDINKNSVKFNLYSQAPLVLQNKISLDWPVTGIQSYALLYNDKENKESVEAIFTKSIGQVRSEWDSWLQQIK